MADDLQEALACISLLAPLRVALATFMASRCTWQCCNCSTISRARNESRGCRLCID